MSQLRTAININSLPDDENSYELLQPGWYVGTIEETELKTTAAGTGQYIKLRLRLENNRVLFTNLNIANPNITAQNIGLAQLKTIMGIGGLTDISETDQLCGIRMSVKVAIKEAQGGYEAQNEIKAFKSASTSSAPSFSAPSAPAAQAPAPAPAQPDFDEDLPF